MNDDIVTRLREPGLCGWTTQKQAADQIEQLRTEITELQARLRDTYKERDYWEWAARGQ